MTPTVTDSYHLVQTAQRMEPLIESAGPIASSSKKSRSALPHQRVKRGADKESIDASLHSILPNTRLAPSLHSTHTSIRPSASLVRISDKKLRAKLASQQVAHKRAVVEREDVQEYLNNAGEAGGIEVEEELGERTWQVGQEEVKDSIAEGSRGKRFDLKMENVGGGGFRVDYTRNGRHVALASNHGHVSTMDWQAGRLHSEIQLGESVRDVKFLHSEAFYAVAQKKYVFIYDGSGTEIHKLKQHIDVTRLEFLPYHYLLTTVGNAGHLKYHDTSTGQIVAEHKTRMGSVQAMTQNQHSGIIHLGHQNGVVSLWSPNLSTPHVKLLAHLGPIQSVAVDPSASSCGRYMATSGADGKVKIWDGRMWGKTVREWGLRTSGLHELGYSMKGMLAVGQRGGVTVYRDLHEGPKHSPTPYMQLPLPAQTPRSVVFCPFEDVLGVGHSGGFSSLLVPGSGEAQFDSNEADVFESYGRRREREVRGVMEKIAPDLITMDVNFLGRLGEGKKEAYTERETPFYKKPRLERLAIEGKADEIGAGGLDDGAVSGAESGAEQAGLGEGGVAREKLKHKMRGKNKSMKRYLRKKRKNVVDPAMVAIKEKLAKQQAQREHAKKVQSGQITVESGALARFT